MKKAIIYVSMFFFILTGNVYAKEILVIGILDFPPFYNVKHANAPSGILLDYLKIVVEKAGYSYRVIGYPPKRLFKALREGKANMSAGIKRLDAYGSDVIFSKNKITDIDVRLYSRMDTPLLDSKEELKGKRVLGIAGYSYGGFLDFLKDPANGIIFDTSNDHDLMFKKLFARRADYALDYYKPSENAMRRLNVSHVQSRSLFKVDVYFILSNKTPNVSGVMTRLEKASDDLRKEGWTFFP